MSSIDLHVQTEENLEDDEYVLTGFLGELYSFDVFKTYKWVENEDLVCHVGEIHSVHSECIYRTSENHLTKAEAYMDVVGYLLNLLKRTYAYRDITYKDLNIIQTPYTRLVRDEVSE